MFAGKGITTTTATTRILLFSAYPMQRALPLSRGVYTSRTLLRLSSSTTPTPPSDNNNNGDTSNSSSSSNSTTTNNRSDNKSKDSESESSAPINNPEYQLPAPDENAAVPLKVGSSASLDALGPLVVNVDGSVGRVANWGGMIPSEREGTLRLLRRRNADRLAALRQKEHGEGKQGI